MSDSDEDFPPFIVMLDYFCKKIRASSRVPRNVLVFNGRNRTLELLQGPDDQFVQVLRLNKECFYRLSSLLTENGLGDTRSISAHEQQFKSSITLLLIKIYLLCVALGLHWSDGQNKTGSAATASSSRETSQSAKVFPNVAISPLQRFQIIDSDSDSDDPSTSVDIKRKDPIIDQSSKKQQSNPGHSVAATEKMRKALDGMTRKADLWKDFSPVKSFHLPTPALVEVCEEYFRSMKNTNSAEKVGRDSCVKSSSGFDRTTNGQNMEQVWNLDDPLPPSHLYFFSEDPRIRILVCNCLPNFFPLGVTENRGNQQNCASASDYMGQFGEPRKRQTTQQVHLERSSKRGRNNSNSGQVLFDSPSSMNPGKGNATGRSNAKKSSSKGREKLNGDASGSWVDPKQGKGKQKSSAKKTSQTTSNASLKSNGGEALHDSGNWMDPRSSGSITNESGRKRVQANAQSAGHWFTGSDGRKVYVNKKGQKLTGQIAYRQYKKNGSGFKRGKKKTSSKKKG
ncbi:hypothetical protein UlMin_003626 [Ulmus minor]